LGPPHVLARFGLIDGRPLFGKRLHQRQDGRPASEIDHGAGPVEHHHVEMIADYAHGSKLSSNRSAITSSPKAKAVEAPFPAVTRARRARGCGASIRLACGPRA